MRIRPLNDRLCVRLLPDKPNGSPIVRPDIAEDPVHRGIVVSVGPGGLSESGLRVPVDVSIGDIVHFGKYTDFEQDDLVMIQQGDILVVEDA